MAAAKKKTPRKKTRPRAEIEGGLAETHRGRSNRATGQDDSSMLGRGHGFGPKTSGAGRARPRRDETPEVKMPTRNYGRLAESLSSGKPGERTMESERYTRGSMVKGGYGDRSRSMETTRKPRAAPKGR
jgi:hypothetical protein